LARRRFASGPSSVNHLSEVTMQQLSQRETEEVGGGNGITFLGFLTGYAMESASMFYGSLPVGTIL
jgi:hypothetical protein